MPDYQKSKIYEIVNDETDEKYIGSTSVLLCKRMAQHRSDYKHVYLKYGYMKQTSARILKYASAKIILIENYPCNSKEELEARERYWIKNSKCVNRVHPGRTSKEYREENKEKIKEMKKKYFENNKERLKEKNKKYYKQNKEIIDEKNKKYSEDNKEKMKDYHKQWREENKEVLKEKKKEYYEKNKEELNKKKKQYRENMSENNKEKMKENDKKYRQNHKEERKEYCKKNKEKLLNQARVRYQKNKEKIHKYDSQQKTCECGCVMNRSSLPKHRKSQKHINLMKQKSEE